MTTPWTEPEDLRERLLALRDHIEEERTHDAQWYRSMTVLHWINDVLDPPGNQDRRSMTDAPDERTDG